MSEVQRGIFCGFYGFYAPRFLKKEEMDTLLIFMTLGMGAACYVWFQAGKLSGYKKAHDELKEQLKDFLPKN